MKNSILRQFIKIGLILFLPLATSIAHAELLAVCLERHLDTTLSTEAAPEPYSFDSHRSFRVRYKHGNPYNGNPFSMRQRRYLESIGVRFDKESIYFDDPAGVILTTNKNVDKMVKNGILTEEQTIRWSDLYVGHDGEGAPLGRGKA